MKNNFLFILFLTLIGTFSSFTGLAQDGSKWVLPNVEIRDLKNVPVMASELKNSDGPMVISFWATWCKPCIQELNAINDLYVDWQDETGVKVIAVSIDDTRNVPKVAPLVNGKGWEYEVYVDANSDLRRALNVQTIPHTFLLDKDGNIVWQHNGYTPGEEEDLYTLIEKVANGEEISH